MSLFLGHDRAEEVTLRVGYETSNGFYTMASGMFTYRLDPTHCVAEFLADCVNSRNKLGLLSRMDFTSCHSSSEARAVFDDKLTHSFQRLALPSDWTLCKGDEQRETLLHFSARLGLTKFTDHLMKLTGGRTAALTSNEDGEQPIDVARRMGHGEIVDLMVSLTEDTEGGEMKTTTNLSRFIESLSV
jgi:hypothetical protein